MTSKYSFFCLILFVTIGNCYSKTPRYSIKFSLKICDDRKIEIKNRLVKKYRLNVTMPNQTEYNCNYRGSYIKCRIMQCRLQITDMFKRNISIYNMELVKGIKNKWKTPVF